METFRRLGQHGIEGDAAALAMLISKVVCLREALTDSTYYDVALSSGTYTIDVTGTPWNLPAGVRAVLARLSVRWSGTINNTMFATLRPYGASSAPLVVRPQVSDYINDGSGLVATDASGRLTLTLNANVSWIRIEIWGYVT